MNKPSQVSLTVLLIFSFLVLVTEVEGKPCVRRSFNKNNTCSFTKCDARCVRLHKGYGDCRHGERPTDKPGTLRCYCTYPC
ncbi:PREDICTED: defensin-like protein 153 [Camelina sativa]|uniref:Defensin-like protein 153 n=1 Tax=Camelina sativa TaxID=90675 RepID=A0ABM1RJR0_CAMSA|nr:PREDICTED: defensin-like protein 153 [Camelina sativa]